MSDEVSDFLRSVEQLKDRRLEEDEARSRQLEETILQEKRERQARRAERARSISPQKSSPASTPPPSQHHHHRLNSSQTSDVLKLSSSPQGFASANVVPAASPSPAVTALSLSSLPTKENEAPFDVESKTASKPPASSHTPLARTPTLSWQQRRPPSSAGPQQPAATDRSRSRPLSVVAAENAAAARSSTPARGESEQTSEPTTASDAGDAPVSRDQIAQALLAKDPSWFRQTPDRGRASAAYRRSQVEDDDRQDLTAASAQLHGLARGSSPAEPDPQPRKLPALPSSPMASPFSPPHVPALTPRGGVVGVAGSNSIRLGSPLPLTPTQTFEPPRDALVASSSPPPSGRTTSPTRSPARSLSPTKGAGGFVQSAMMKRSDSVKRWSVTSPPGLQRADLIAAHRQTPTPNPLTKPTSRPTSSHGPSGLSMDSKMDSRIDSASNCRPSTPTRTAQGSPEEKPAEAKEAKVKEAVDEKTTPPPVSPSKTMDPRRWSPTKTSSWLDAALSKSESPKAKAAQPPNNQPAWMVELNKAKAQKASGGGSDAGVDGGAADGAARARAPSVVRKHEVRTGGLLRTTPMGATTVPPPVVAPAAAASPLPIRSAGVGAGVPAAKPSTKPSTPPKSDFRTSLKPRQPLPSEKQDGDGSGSSSGSGSSGGGGSGGNELQNVVGALRRTKTQNYVAPDMLKDNILRGKSALTATGGPQPREKTDALKDAIVQKKEQFQQAKAAGRGVAAINAAKSPPAVADKPPLPEGVAKRLTLNRTGGAVRGESVRSGSPVPPVVLLERQGSDGRTPPPRLGAKSSSSALAGRFNPALAGLLARGPPGSAPGGGGSATVGTSETALPALAAAAASSSAVDGPPGPGPQLTHMTKGRARGPRRKAPSSLVPAKVDSKLEDKADKAAPETLARKSPPLVSPKRADVAQRVVSSGSASGKKAAPLPAAKPAVWSPPRRSVSGGGLSSSPLPSPKPSGLAGEPVDATAKTAVATSPSPLRAKTFPQGDKAAAAKSVPPVKSKSSSGIVAQASAVQPAPEAVVPPPASLSRPSSPGKVDVKRMSQFLERVASPSPAVTATTAEPPLLRRRPLSPFKTGDNAARPLPEPRPLSPQKTGGNARPLPAAPGKGSALGKAPALARVEAQMKPVPPPQKPKPASPQPQTRTVPVSSPSTRTPSSSQALDVSAMLRAFFGPQEPGHAYLADAATILARRPWAGAAVQTVKAQLLRLTSDGKTAPVARQHERVLFAGEMYLCPHTFTVGEAGWKRTEVYWWVGEAVPAAQVQDVEVFLGREARALGGPLVRVRQGREPAALLQALGGMVVVRRGTSSRFDQLAAAVLCGRRLAGGQAVVFDEVDAAAGSLCSGFPFLVTRQGRCTLWKGRGSHVDELSCARLMGMDLALMGELAEVDEGQEPVDFWGLFPGGDGGGGGGGRPGSADHWRLKPKYDYGARLFRTEGGEGEQIVEIYPFHQDDLAADGVFVLDAFFELYIVVGARAQTQYAAFRNALAFAQEYAILAASMEDRPFVPVATVVLEGVPRDLKSVFRAWRDGGAGDTPNRTASSSSSLKRGRSLRIVPLTVALQALAE